MMAAAVFVVILGAASVVGIADAGQPTVAPSVAATPAVSSPYIAVIASPTGFPFGDPTWWPATTANAYIPTPTPGPATPTPVPKAKPTPVPKAKPTPVPKAKPTPVPTPRDTVWNARIYAKNRLGIKQYDCLNVIFTYESKWNPQAGNPAGAYGIPQALPGSKMAAFGSNWRNSPLVQVKWGIWYVNSRYGSACAANAFLQSYGWY
jgi:hypothetical protein